MYSLVYFSPFQTMGTVTILFLTNFPQTGISCTVDTFMGLYGNRVHAWVYNESACELPTNLGDLCLKAGWWTHACKHVHTHIHPVCVKLVAFDLIAFDW